MVATLGEHRLERTLDLKSLIEDLHAAGLLSDTERARLSDVNAGSVHPLVYLSEQKLVNAATSRPLDMDALLHWLRVDGPMPLGVLIVIYGLLPILNVLLIFGLAALGYSDAWFDYRARAKRNKAQ